MGDYVDSKVVANTPGNPDETPHLISFDEAISSQVNSSNGIVIINSAAGENLTDHSVNLINRTCPIYGMKGLVPKSTEETVVHDFMDALETNLSPERLQSTYFALVDDNKDDLYFRRASIEILFKRHNLGTPTIVEYDSISDPSTAANIVSDAVEKGFEPKNILALVDVMMPVVVADMDKEIEARANGSASSDIRDRGYRNRTQRNGVTVAIEIKGEIGKAERRRKGSEA